MGAVDFFGKVVCDNYERHPVFTRNFIKAGYGAQSLLLRYRPDPRFLPSQRCLTQLCMKYTLAPLRRPGRSVMANIFAPPELLHAMGLYPLFAEGFSSYLTGGKCERVFLDAAERNGVPVTYCSYHKALIGAVEAGVIRKPRFVVTTSTACDANTSTFRRIAKHYGLEEFYIDVPFEMNGESVEYVSDQIKKLAVFAQGVMGENLDRNKLAAAIRNTNQSVRYYRLFVEQLREKYFPSSVTLEMFRIFTGHLLMGTNEALEFYRLQYQDILRCGKSNAKRVLWSHVLPYYLEPLKSALDFNENVQLLLSDMNFDAMLELDEFKPYESMAKRLIMNHFNGGFGRKVDSVLKMTDRLRADAAICYCHWGCRQSNGGAFLLKKALSAKGMPTLILDGDACDRRNTNEGQTATRLQAFLEILEGRK
jgi:benzoyl-CoA reductase/2-hydroxyglutaryl-CoA dehydratase subunit BcrC/BadD/HgdB